MHIQDQRNLSAGSPKAVGRGGGRGQAARGDGVGGGGGLRFKKEVQNEREGGRDKMREAQATIEMLRKRVEELQQRERALERELEGERKEREIERAQVEASVRSCH